nr:hypothetical protein [Tanacetum cinerariifolium]
MEFESAQNNTTAKLPILKLGEYEMWVIRIKHQYNDAKPMFAAIETRFGGNEATKKTQTTLLKKQYKNFNASSTESLDSIFNRLQKIDSRHAILGVIITQEDLNSKFLRSLSLEWNTHVVVWMNKADIETMSIDDLYNNFKIIKPDVKKSVGTSIGAQNIAFMTAPSTSNTNDVNTDNPTYKASTVSPNVNIASPQVSTANFSDNVVYAFMVKNPNGSNLLQNQDGRLRNQDNTKKQGNNEATSSKAMLAIDAATYKRCLATVEEQLVTYKKNEFLFSEEVAVLKKEVACKDYEINVLKSEFEKVKQEKEDIEFKIKKFDNASKSLDKLIGSQITDNSKKGLGYHVVPPPHPLTYNGPTKLDLSYSGLDEFKEPEFKGYGPRDNTTDTTTTTTTTTSGETGTKSGRTVTLTTEDMQKKKNDVKARTTLLLSLPDEHQLRFRKYKTARELWATILKTFGGNEAIKKTKKNLLKQQYGNFRAKGSETLEKTFSRLQVIVGQLQFMDVEVEQEDLNQKFLISLALEWLMHTIVWRNMSDLDTMSLDDLYNHLKVYESEVQKKTEPNSQNMAFISSAKHNSGKKMDINQIDEDNMEKMDIKWNMALLSMRADKFWKRTGKKISIQGSDVAGFDKSKVECFSCHKMGHFAREPSPTVESTSEENQNRNPSVSKNVASPITPKPFIKFVKPKDSQSESKTDKKETSKKPPVKYAEQFRKPNKKPNVRGNKRNWNNLKSHQLGPEFVMKKKACFNSVMKIFRLGFLGKPTISDVEKLYVRHEKKHGLPGTLGNLDFTDWAWFGFPVAHKAQYCRRYHGPDPFILLEAIACKVLWIWQAFLVFLGRTTTSILFIVPMIYLEWVPFVKSVTKLFDDDHKRLRYKARMKGRNVSNGIRRENIHRMTSYDSMNKGIELSGKFEEKGDEGYFIRYSMSSKAFRVFNKRTRRVEENLHVEFIENKAIEKGAGPNWLFDIDSLTKSMNYVPVDAGTISTKLSGTKDTTSQEVKKDVSSLRYIALPNWAHDALLEFSSSKPQDHYSTEVFEGSGNTNPTTSTSNPPADHMETLTVETPIPTVSSPVPTAYSTDSQDSSNILGGTTNSDESNGEAADISNMETAISASPTPTLRIHKAHPKSQIIDPVDTLIQTRNKSKEMDVKSAFLYGTIDEEVYVMQPPGFQDPEYPAKVYKVEKVMYGSHQAPRAWYGTLSKYLLKNGFHRVKRIFRYLKGHPKLGFWYPKDSSFDLVAYSDSDYGGATQDHKSTTRGCQFLGRRLIEKCRRSV